MPKYLFECATTYVPFGRSLHETVEERNDDKILLLLL